jgi:regulator of sigma E protease
MIFLIFLIILGVLVFVHELGHFLLAKWARVKVDEFGFGYPPRAMKIGEKWGTLFTLNWIPFGGFVKIVGEDYEEEPAENTPEARYTKHLGSGGSDFQPVLKEDKSFTQVSKKWQAAILVAGVTFNIIFAWFLFSLGFMIGLPTSVDNNFGGEVKNPVLTITGLVDSSPAQKAGLKTGDKIKEISLSGGTKLQDLKPEAVSDFINNSSGEVAVEVDRGGKILDFKLTPETGTEKGRKIIGISMDMVGTLYLPIHKAIYEGGKTTLKLSLLTVEGIANLIKNAVRWKADISEVAGPVGIIGLVGDATRLGFAYLLTFTALISINLAIINLVPFPALDGGRILFVAIEGITKRKINPKIANTLNTAGFAILIALMLIVTYRDILKLF